MGWEAWYTLVVTLLAMVLFARELYAPANIMLGASIAMLLAGVVTPEEAFGGFANSAPITVAALYVLARGVEKTGLLQPVLAILLGRDTGRSGLTRLNAAAGAASVFLNNTPIVAMLITPVIDWAHRQGRSPSRYLMPLSFAVILGGVVTLIGTSTNLVVSGMLEARTGSPMGMFEITPLGLPVALVGLAVLALTAGRLLPDRRPARRTLDEQFREFSVHMNVVSGGPLDGLTIEAAGLRSLQGVFLIEIERAAQVIAPVAPSAELRGGDRLCFVGRVDQIIDLQAMRGLAHTDAQNLRAYDTARHTFFQAVIGAASPLVGRTLKESAFRARYQSAVVAIHRSGERLNTKLGDVQLRVGDTLLLLADPGFPIRWRDRNDFLLIARLEGTPPGATRKASLVGLLVAGVVVAAGLGILPILQASLVAAIALVGFGVLTANEARGAVDLDVVILIAASFGVAAAMENSGLATWAAEAIVGLTTGGGALLALAGVMIATLIVTELVTNNAAAALLFPVAFATGEQVGADPRVFALAVAVMASCSFLTPIGYQTNTMVYGPGGYRFTDYVRVGFPLTLVVLSVTLFVMHFYYGL